MGKKNLSRGSELAARLFRGMGQARRAARPGARDLPKLTGLTPQGIFLDGQENVLLQARECLVESQVVFRYGDSTVMEVGNDHDGKLVPLMDEGNVAKRAHYVLGNCFCCEFSPGEDQAPRQFAPPREFVSLLLHSQLLAQTLLKISLYAKRPVFDEAFRFCGQGWNPDSGFLIHGPEIDPVIFNNPAGEGPFMDRLPPRLRELLGDFCFRSDADRANAVAILLTSMLIPAFMEPPKPMCLLDGNQPSVGKTLFARVCGMILDGVDPAVIHFTVNNDELEKKLCASLRRMQQTVIIIDNAKVRAGDFVESAVLESNVLASRISLRILGTSTIFDRPNDCIWFLTMNGTKASPDLVTRGVPVRFLYEGDPRLRSFAGRDPIAFARRHRVAILGELAGMIFRWLQSGREEGPPIHRCSRWSEVLGGILHANHIPEFLANMEEAAAEFDVVADELSTLIDVALEEKDLVHMPGAAVVDKDSGRPAQGWVEIFHKGGLLREELSKAKSQRSKDTLVGRRLSQFVGRRVPINIDGKDGTATLCVTDKRHKVKRYTVQIAWESNEQESTEQKEVQPAASDLMRETPGKPSAAQSEGNVEEW